MTNKNGTDSGHEKHLCHLVSNRMHRDNPDQYQGLVQEPRFVCKDCGRVAHDKENLCTPTALGQWDE